MKNPYLFKRLLPCILIFLTTSLSVAQTNIVKREIPSFTGIDVGDKIIVRLVKADKESAEIQAQGIDASAVKTEWSDNILKLSIYGEPFTKKKVLVTLYYVKLSFISVNGGADVTTTSLLKSDILNVELKSGGMLTLDADLESLSGKVIEGALLTSEGYANHVNMTVATSGTFSAYELESENAIIKASSGGKAKINVEKELNTEVSSKGYVSYKGNPEKINKNTTSGGTVAPYQP